MTEKEKADAKFREVGLDPVAIDASRAADDRRYEESIREVERKCPGSIIGPPQVYRINYRTADGGNPTFVHVRAGNAISALIAFIDETSSLKVSSLKLVNEYDGPILNERENFWPEITQEKSATKDRVVIETATEDDTKNHA